VTRPFLLFRDRYSSGGAAEETAFRNKKSSAPRCWYVFISKFTDRRELSDGSYVSERAPIPTGAAPAAAVNSSTGVGHPLYHVGHCRTLPGGSLSRARFQRAWSASGSEKAACLRWSTAAAAVSDRVKTVSRTGSTSITQPRICIATMLGQETRRVQSRLPDEALYALALYIYSLKPSPNPNPFNEKAQAGQKIFAREGCPACHTPPLYTRNRITLAQGFDPPSDAPAALDILRISVGTDPGLALGTRKGTGYYKVPSLKGVWYRGHYLHDGSAASLEEMFDPDRLKETHEPGGWLPVGAKTHAIQGHEFGLRLEPAERNQLIAFLRTL
jgi:hypothetical protein